MDFTNSIENDRESVVISDWGMSYDYESIWLLLHCVYEPLFLDHLICGLDRKASISTGEVLTRAKTDGESQTSVVECSLT